MQQQLTLSKGISIAASLVVVGTGSFQKANSITHEINNVKEETSSMLKRREAILSDIEALLLSPAQDDKIEAIGVEMTAQLADILSPAQMESFQSARSQGRDMRSVMMNLGLSSGQRSQVISLMRTTQNEIMSLLTPEQRAYIEDKLPQDRN